MTNIEAFMISTSWVETLTNTLFRSDGLKSYLRVRTLVQQCGEGRLAGADGVGGGQGGEVGGGGLPAAVGGAPGALRPVAEAVAVLALPVAQIQPHHRPLQPAVCAQGFRRSCQHYQERKEMRSHRQPTSVTLLD